MAAGQSESQLRAAFDFFDSDGTGRLEVKELVQVMNALGQCMTDSEVEEIIQKEGLTSKNGLEFADFVDLFKKYGKEGDKVCREIKEAFKAFDRKKRNYLTKEDLYVVLTQIGHFPVSEEEAEMCFNSFDTDGNGKMDYNGACWVQLAELANSQLPAAVAAEFANFLCAVCPNFEDVQRLKLK